MTTPTPTASPMPLRQAAAEALTVRREQAAAAAQQARDELVAAARSSGSRALAPHDLTPAVVVHVNTAAGLVVFALDELYLAVRRDGQLQLVDVLDGQVQERSGPIPSLADLGAALEARR